ncbi:MAG: CitMHS family transporter [Lachnospiraceae bacterium]
MAAFVGFLMLFAIMFLLMRNKMMPIVIFVTIPVIAALLLGFGLKDIGGMVNDGLDSVWKTAVLFIFSTSYFGIMNDAGMFDPVVEGLVKISRGNVLLVTMASAIVAVLGHLDGATATTVLVTIPAMLPLYRRLKISPYTLLLITGCAMGIMNLVPWGGPIVRVATVLNMDTTELWHILLPFQGVCLIAVLVIAAICGMLEKRRGAGSFTTEELQQMEEVKEDPEIAALKRPKLFLFNILLTLVLIVFLCLSIMPTHVCFMIAFGIGVSVNYPGLKNQSARFKAHAGEALNMSATLLAAAVFIGVMRSSGMLDAMVDVLLSVIPDAMGRYMNVIAGLISVPVGAVLGADTFYYGVFPLLGEAGAAFGVPQLDVGVAMLIGKNVGMIVSPMQPTTYLACGLAGVEVSDHLRKNFGKSWLISIVLCVLALLMGVMHIY